MKQWLAGVCCLGVVFLSTPGLAADAPFHIGMAMSSVSQTEDTARAAEALVKRYGDAAEGGMIKHVTMPDNFMTEMETTISLITSLADDPLLKAVVVFQAVPGTAEAFRRIRAKRPDVLLFAGEPHEDPEVISSVADIVISPESIARGYLLVSAAQRLGATDFVHISFPRHMSFELLSRQRMVIKEACNDLGLRFHIETAPDPLSDVGVAGAQQFILEKVPAWIAKYGPNTAFYSTNGAHTEPLLKRLVEGQGFFIEADLPSPLVGYPGALGINMSDVSGNFPAILQRVEETVVQKGGAGRMGTWAYSYSFTTPYALGELAKSFIEQGIDGRSIRRKLTREVVLKAFNDASPGAPWRGTLYRDAQSGLERRNYILVYQDTYIFGKGYLKLTDVAVPEKYFNIR